MDLLAERFPGVVIVKSPENLGFAGANNLGVRHSTGKYVLFLNPDTLLVSPALAAMLSRLPSLASAGVVGCRLLNTDRSIQTSSILHFPTIANAFWQFESLRQRWPRLFGIGPLWSTDGNPAQVEAVSGACMLMRREVFDRVGGFSNEYFMYSEDVDLCYRTQQAGFRNYHIGEGEIVHYGGGSGLPERQASLKAQAELLFCQIHYGRMYSLLFRIMAWINAAARLAIIGALRTFDKSTPRLDAAWMRWKATLSAIVRWQYRPIAMPAARGAGGRTLMAESANDSERHYVLLTAAHNEAELIENTIRSMAGQTVPPRRWIIVSDNSTDATDAIVQHYARQHQFLRLLRVDRPPGRNSGAKVMALRSGQKLLEDVDYRFIGNLDADITLPSDYFEVLLDRFDRNPRLGLAAGFIQEPEGGVFRPRSSNRVDSIPHAAQLLRRECYEGIGGYAILPHGGEDWYAQTRVRMSGWRAEAFPALPVFHHRRTGTAGSILRDRIRLGRLDYSFGSNPLFEVFKCAVRIAERPVLMAAALRLGGFFWSYIQGEERTVTADMIEYLRQEQRTKLLGMFRYMERRGVAEAQPQ